MGRVIDLDAARLARAEAQGEAPVIKFAGKEWQLPLELPWEIAEAAASGDATAALRGIATLLGDRWEEFKSHQPTLADIVVITQHVGELYGAGDQGKV